MSSTRNRIQFECPEILGARLETYLARTGLGASEVIRAALLRYLNEEERRMPAQTNPEQQWAQAQVEAIEPTREAVREFDQSEDGARFARITGMTMWANLGGDTLPTQKMTEQDG